MMDPSQLGKQIVTTHAKDQSCSIPYRPQYTRITGKVAASILVQQISYWWHIKGGKPFYKFRAPCDHDWYKDGDSWTEELGMTPGGFDTALKAIGAKVTKGKSKSELLKVNLVIYWTDADRVTWYQLNEKLFCEMVYLAYNEPQLLGNSGFRNLVDNHGNVNYLYSETTSETTTKEHVASATPALVDSSEQPPEHMEPCEHCRELDYLSDDGLCADCHYQAQMMGEGEFYDTTRAPADAITDGECYQCRGFALLVDLSESGLCSECEQKDTPAEEPQTMLDALVKLRDNPQPGVVTFMSGSPIEPFQDSAGEVVGEICVDCHKFKATTTEMPYKNQTCTCEHERELAAAFGDPKPPPAAEVTPTLHWRERAAQPGATWGEHSEEFQRQLAQYGAAGQKVRSLGEDFERLTGLAPDWDDKSEVKSWSSGLWKCLRAAGGDAKIVLDAVRKAKQDGLTISKPYSAVEVTRALFGERRCTPPGGKSGGMSTGIVYA